MVVISRILRGTVIGSIGCFTAVGCSTGPQGENTALMQQNRELQSQLDASNARLKSAVDPSQLQAMQAAIADRDKQIADLQARPQTVAQTASFVPDEAPVRSIAGMETSVDKKAGTLTVTLPGDVLFDSGKADLKPSAQDTLDQVALALRTDFAGKKLRVEGHTDSDPITRTKADWDDNLELSLARAAAVSRYLMREGVSAKLLTTSGYGSSHPRGSVKPKNRRVEIVVVTR